MPRKLFLPVVTLLLLIVSSAFADTIYLKNGDRLTGTVVSLKNSILVFHTEYAGKLSLQWIEVASVETETPVQLKLETGTTVNSRLTTDKGGQAMVTLPEARIPFAVSLSDIILINPPPPEAPVKLTGRLNAGFSISDGNTQTKSAELDGEIVARGESNRMTLGATHQRQEDAGEETEDNSTAYIKYDHFITKRWYLLANATGTEDKFADLNLRTDFGAGVGHQFWEEDRRNLSFEAGVSYVNEDFIEADDDNYYAGRWAVNFDHLIAHSSVVFFHHHEGLISIENSDDLIIRSRTGLRIPVYKGLHTTIDVKWEWDNSPAADQEKNDTDYNFSFGYSF